MQIYHKFGDLSILFAISFKIHNDRLSPITMKGAPAVMLKQVQHDKVVRLADVGQPNRRTEATRRILGLSGVLS
jgi:hypothetical protein